MWFVAMMSAAVAGPSVVDSYFETVWNAGDTAAVADLVTADFVGRTMAADQKDAVGPEGLAAWVTGVRGFLPDGKKTVTHQVQRGDSVVVQVTMTASSPSGGAPITVDQVHWLELRGGRIASDRVYFDLGTVMKQLQGDK